MVNSRASKGLILLDYHKATGTEATYTYTPVPVIPQGKYKKLFLTITGLTTAALALQMKISGLTSGYAYTTSENDSGTRAETADESASLVELISIELLDVARSFQCEIELSMNLTGNVHYSWKGLAFAEGDSQGYGGVSDTTIDSIELLVSTSTWGSGTEITLYGQI